MDFLLAEQNLPFAAAAALVAALAALEAVLLALGLSSALEAGDGAGAAEVAGDAADGVGGALSWMGVGRVPAIALAACALGGYAGAGFLMQGASSALLGGLLPSWIPALAATPAAVLSARWGGLAVSRLVPRTETSSVREGDLVGRPARVTSGTARDGGPAAEAAVALPSGQTLWVRVLPPAGGADLAPGAEVVLMSHEVPPGGGAGLFRAVALQDQRGAPP